MQDKSNLFKLSRCITIIAFLLIGNIGELQAQDLNRPSVVKGPAGQEYSTVVIGDQVWMKENLNTDQFANGDLIQEAKLPSEWRKARKDSIPAWSYYENKPENGDKYGKLYNWYAVADPRGICPEGWIVPNEEDWKEMMIHLGMKPDTFDEFGWRGSIAPTLISRRTAPDSHPRWDAPNELATNSSSFDALPGGYRVGNPNYDAQQENLFRYIGKEATFWSGENEIARGLWTDRIEVFKGGANLSSGFGFSVRCVKK